MISIRSTISRSIIRGKSTPNAAAAFLQANVPFPSSSSDEAITNNNGTVSSHSVRHFVSPAHRRYLKKTAFLEQNIHGLRPTIGAQVPGIQVPSLDVAKHMGKTFSEMENEPLMVIAEMGSYSARCEVMQRHIMAVDGIEYDQAGEKLKEINIKSREGLYLYVLPYQILIAISLCLGVGAIPMVFDLNTAIPFNYHYVTMEVPIPSELDTVLETGAWTWNWMEPLTGTLSFSLLTFQFARQQMLKLGIKPVTEKILARRSQKLIDAFPQYNARLLSNIVAADPMVK